MVETGQVSREDLAEMEQYLGPSVLAKLQSLDDEDFEAYEGDAPEVDQVVADVIANVENATE